jgi:hypothetical protein
MGKNQKQTVYAFIDSQNLNLGIRSQGWDLDFRKFRAYIQDQYNVQKAYIFIGQVEGDESLYGNLQDMGYSLVLKPTTELNLQQTLQVRVKIQSRNPRKPQRRQEQTTKYPRW